MDTGDVSPQNSVTRIFPKIAQRRKYFSEISTGFEWIRNTFIPYIAQIEESGINFALEVIRVRGIWFRWAPKIYI
jgi:hypothetical protein